MRILWFVCSAVLFLVGAGLIAAGLVVIYKIIPDKVHDDTVAQKPLGYNNQSFNDITTAWMNPTYNGHIQYWFYDYTNVNDILNRGAKPTAVERGPYGYREVMANGNVSFYDDNTASYQQFKTYIFDQSASCATCTPDDLVNVPDLFFFTLIDTLLNPQVIEGILSSNPDLGPIGGFINATVLVNALKEVIGVLTTTFDVVPFTKQPVKNILFDGYNDNLVTNFLPSINTILATLIYDLFQFQIPPLIDPKNIPPVALFYQTNGTGTGVYYIKTGQGDVDNVGQIVRFDPIANKTEGSNGTMLSSNWWNNPDTAGCPAQYNAQARMINGTGGDFFKPFITKDDQLYLYVSDICRSLYLTYDSEMTQSGIDGYRFIVPRPLFDSSHPENCGFCHPPSYSYYPQQTADCLPAGILDVSHCQPVSVSGVTVYPPIVVSNPHFLFADDSVINLINQKAPTVEADQTYIDIEPQSGTILTAMKRLQINVMMHNYPEAYGLDMLQTGAYPLVWINETFIMDQKTRDDLYDALIAPQKTGKMLGWIAVGVGVLLILISLAILVIRCTCAKDKISSHKVRPQGNANLTSYNSDYDSPHEEKWR